jgi:hypothetical protein
MWLATGQVNCRQSQVFMRKVVTATFLLLINNIFPYILPYLLNSTTYSSVHYLIKRLTWPFIQEGGGREGRSLVASRKKEDLLPKDRKIVSLR